MEEPALPPNAGCWGHRWAEIFGAWSLVRVLSSHHRRPGADDPGGSGDGAAHAGTSMARKEMITSMTDRQSKQVSYATSGPSAEREESAMSALPVPSSSGNRTYTVYVLHGKVVGCSCLARRYHPRQVCKHIQAKQAELDQPSCLYCGRRTGGALMCSGCSW